jgi:hypothetical protein
MNGVRPTPPATEARIRGRAAVPVTTGQADDIGRTPMRHPRTWTVILLGLALTGSARPAPQDGTAIWREFVSLLETDALSVDRVRPPSPMSPESQLALLKDFAKRADWEEWAAEPEVVRSGNLISFIITLGQKRNSPWTYTFNFETEGGRWYYRFLEGIVLRLDKIGPLPADASTFPDRSDEDKSWMRQELYWSEQVALFNFLTRESGKESAWRWVRQGLAKGAGYALTATVWVPFYPTHRAFILYLCWEQAKLWGDKVRLEKLDDHEAVVRFEDLTYFVLYERTSHLRQQISFEDYTKIFETIWQERARAAGWALTVDGRRQRIFFRFSR